MSSGLLLLVAGVVVTRRTVHRHQLASLLDWSGLESDVTRKLQLRAQVKRQIAAEGLSDTVWERVRDAGDADLQERVLRHPQARKDHFESLAEHGATKAVRNQAAQRCRRRA